MTMGDIAARTTVDHPAEQVTRLTRLARRRQLARAEVIRRAVMEYLQRQGDQLAEEAFGLWRDRSEDGLAYQRRLRDEWPP